MAALTYKHVLRRATSVWFFRPCLKSYLYVSTYQSIIKSNHCLSNFINFSQGKLHLSVQQQFLQILSINCVKYSKINEDKTSEQIILLGHDETVLGIKTISEAKLLANKKDMKLIKVDKDSTQYKKYPVYQLAKKGQILKVKSDTQNNTRDLKRITLSYRISDHDLNVKFKNIEKWLKKGGCEIFVVITGEEGKEKSMEELYKKIENNFKNSTKFVQKIVKNQFLKFKIIPVMNSPPENEPEENRSNILNQPNKNQPDENKSNILNQSNQNQPVESKS